MKAARPVELDFTPVDNQRLANLCGVMDENLKQLETALEVTITRRGERFSVQGNKDRSARAADLLTRFYAQAGRELTIDDVQLGLVEALGNRGDAPEEGPALSTRRADLRGRTARQRDYIRNVLEHDITFAIGPAGTGKTYLAVACAVDALERDAVKRIVAEGIPADKITEKTIAQRLYLPEMPDPDLMVRTSGEYRISNYLLWELAYSELVFTDVLWPDFRREHLFDAVRQYQARRRRFGGLES